MIVQADGFEFNFPDALAAFVFDEKDKTTATYHGLSHAMKAVDLVVEFPDDTLFVEVKDFHAPDDYNFRAAATEEQKAERNQRFHQLQGVLVHKFRDTWLYRWAERATGAPDKPVRYLCVLSLDNGLLGVLGKELRKALPQGGDASPRWQRPLATGCVVVNPERWHQAFPAWSLTKI